MEDTTVKRLGLLMAVQAEIEGMKAFNAQHPDAHAYQQHDFDAKADQLRGIVNMHPMQL